MPLFCLLCRPEVGFFLTGARRCTNKYETWHVKYTIVPVPSHLEFVGVSYGTTHEGPFVVAIPRKNFIVIGVAVLKL